jgi:undecaprenyl-diphosphatase
LQRGFVEWMNDPPQPFAALLALVNPFLRPVPLTVLSVLLLYWVYASARSRAEQHHVVRAAVVAFVVAEVLAQLLKQLAEQPRPLAVIPGLDAHGYPIDPHGNAFPSAHTAIAVAMVAALWPWMDRKRRAVGATLAVVVATNRIYIGAHWPLDVIGGAAAGMVAATVSWLVESTRGGTPSRSAT